MNTHDNLLLKTISLMLSLCISVSVAIDTEKTALQKNNTSQFDYYVLPNINDLTTTQENSVAKWTNQLITDQTPYSDIKYVTMFFSQVIKSLGANWTFSVGINSIINSFKSMTTEQRVHVAKHAYAYIAKSEDLFYLRSIVEYLAKTDKEKTAAIAENAFYFHTQSFDSISIGLVMDQLNKLPLSMMSEISTYTHDLCAIGEESVGIVISTLSNIPHDQVADIVEHAKHIKTTISSKIKLCDISSALNMIEKDQRSDVIQCAKVIISDPLYTTHTRGILESLSKIDKKNRTKISIHGYRLLAERQISEGHPELIFSAFREINSEQVEPIVTQALEKIQQKATGIEALMELMSLTSK